MIVTKIINTFSHVAAKNSAGSDTGAIKYTKTLNADTVTFSGTSIRVWNENSEKNLQLAREIAQDYDINSPLPAIGANEAFIQKHLEVERTKGEDACGVLEEQFGTSALISDIEANLEEKYPKEVVLREIRREKSIEESKFYANLLLQKYPDANITLKDIALRQQEKYDGSEEHEACALLTKKYKPDAPLRLLNVMLNESFFNIGAEESRALITLKNVIEANKSCAQDRTKEASDMTLPECRKLLDKMREREAAALARVQWAQEANELIIKRNSVGRSPAAVSGNEYTIKDAVDAFLDRSL